MNHHVKKFMTMNISYPKCSNSVPPMPAIIGYGKYYAVLSPLLLLESASLCDDKVKPVALHIAFVRIRSQKFLYPHEEAEVLRIFPLFY
ncbi:hypothetical protein ACIQCX_22735, partial [Enterobacter cancerogenus]|uniref:hypothetical protein n=1 Tax=Enterobacter cancerogenus TaxID=69218 RepID=UPI0037F2ABD5